MNTTFAARIGDALAKDDDSRFLECLSDIDPRFTPVDTAERPEPLAMFSGLLALHLDVTREGIWKYLAESEGDDFHRALGWCRTIGAPKAAEYLRAVQRVFPRGKVPADADERYDVVEDLEARAARTGDPEPLRELDARYAAAMPELARRLRAWVSANRATIARDLAALQPPAPVDERAALTALDAALRKVDRIMSGDQKQHRARVATLRSAAAKAGLSPSRGPADRDRLARFIAEASALTQKQWTSVAQRYQQSQAKIQKTLMRAFGLSQQIRSGQLGDATGYERRHQEANAAITSLYRITDALPKQVTVAGRKIGLLTGAHQAVAGATAAIRLHEWFMLTPADVQLARDAYAPFTGVAWTPDVPGETPTPGTATPTSSGTVRTRAGKKRGRKTAPARSKAPKRKRR